MWLEVKIKYLHKQRELKTHTVKHSNEKLNYAGMYINFDRKSKSVCTYGCMHILEFKFKIWLIWKINNL